MPMFKVTLEKPMGLYGANNRPMNPFLVGDIFNPHLHVKKLLREFTFEADDEEHVKLLLQQARTAGCDNVKGYDLRSIELVPATDCEPAFKRF